MNNNCSVYGLASSSIGGRREQQDSYGYKQVNGDTLAIVCDGMGGLKGGKAASDGAVEYILNQFETEEIDEIPRFLLNAAMEADQLIYGMTDENGQRMNAGSTLVGAFIRGSEMYFVSVGDSRMYIYRGGEMTQVTQDHNYSYLLEGKKDMMSQEAYENEKKHGEALISYLGMGGIEYVSHNPTTAIELYEGDYILLCSDGLYKRLSDQRIKRVLSAASQGLGLENALKVLQAEAASTKTQFSQDNTTIILMAYL